MDGFFFRRWALFAMMLAVAGTSSGCHELRGRRKAREGTHLYREGHYAEAVAAFEAAEALVPRFWVVPLNKGLTCRQMMVPGGRGPENDRAISCALAAFAAFKRLRPQDPRADQLYIQTLFDADRFAELAAIYQQRLRDKPNDLAAINGLIQAYTRWNRPEEALRAYQQRAALEPGDAEAQYAIGVFLWSQLFQKGGGAEMASFDPRPDPDHPAQKKIPPPAGLGDIVGPQRARLADLGIAHLQKALALRPRYPEAMTYLNLLYRQKSYAYFADPAEWQANVDTAERWRRQAETLSRGN